MLIRCRGAPLSSCVGAPLHETCANEFARLHEIRPEKYFAINMRETATEDSKTRMYVVGSFYLSSALQ